jgi:dihydroorotate dehydrogenase (NAD+) catalytic subunit
MINSIGLPNKGLDGYLAEDLPVISGFRSDPAAGAEALPVPVITNVMGSTAEELGELVEACDAHEAIAAIELNVSCPNVATGLDIGADPAELERVLTSLRPRTAKPLIVKLTPNAADVPACALGAQAGGADAVSLINTLRAAAPAPGGNGRQWLGGGTGGLSGPAIRPVALAQVAAVAATVEIPVIGMGGVQSAEHARQLLDVGASLVAVGTESFRDPAAGARIAAGLS